MFRTSVCLWTLGALVRAASADPISLEQALRRAAARPSVAMAVADRDAARGNADTAAAPLYNPALEASTGPRWSAGSTRLAASVGLAQTVELGGKRRARAEAAEARLRIAEVDVATASRLARVDGWRAYQLAAIAELRVAAARDAEATAAGVVEATQQSQSLGGETQLRLNLAISDLGRARHDRADAENGRAAALAELATAIGANATEVVEPVPGDPALPPAGDEAAQVERARASRPELARARSELAAAHADARLADAVAVPDVTLSVTYNYEPDADVRTQAVLVGASLALPVRTRNQGQRTATRALAHRAQLDAARVEVEVEREARVAAQRYARALAAVQGFDRDVSEKLHDNLQLAADSYRAGKIDFYAFAIARRELFANRLGYLDAVAEAIDAWAALARAANLEVTP